MAKQQTPIQEILADLNGGAFAAMLETVMADVAQVKRPANAGFYLGEII